MEKFETITFKDNDFEIDIRIFDNSAWISFKDLCLFFDKSKTTMLYQIRKLFDSSKKEEKSVVSVVQKNTQKFRTTGPDGKVYLTNYYSKEIALKLAEKFDPDRGLILKQFIDNRLSIESHFDNKNNEIIIYDNGIVHVPLSFSKKEETIWASQEQIADLFETTQPNVSMHIKNILIDKELEAISVYKDFLYTAQDGKQYEVTFYNFDMILAIGYRVKTSKAIAFRNWATSILKDFILKGYSINEQKCLECQNKILEIQNEVLKLKDEIQNQITFYPGQELFGFAAIEKFLKSAKHEILIVDNYFNHDFDLVLSKLNVKKTIITNPQNKKIESNENYNVIKINTDHDRYLLVDDTCYHFGQSFADIGTKISTATKIKDKKTIEYLKNLKEI